tara:strand:- start:11958 stop:13019 length:1062 start_codon:yes stop_codon:yes gene_type:complete
MLQLLCKPLPIKSEALQHYVIRLAGKNGYSLSSMNQLIKKVCNTGFHSYKQSHRIALRDAVFQLTGHHEVNDLFDPHLLHTKKKKAFDFHRVKVCSACLQENKPYDADWYYRHKLVCNTHNIFLIDNCPSCSERFTEKTLSTIKCGSCEYSLNHIFKKQSLPSEDYTQQYFSAVKNKEFMPEKILGLEPFFELNAPGSFQLWCNKSDSSIEDMFNSLQSAIELSFDYEKLRSLIINQVKNAEQKDTISQGLASFKKYLKHDKYPDFIEHFINVILTIKGEFDELVVPIQWLESVFKVKVVYTRDINQRYNQGYTEKDIIFRWKKMHAIKFSNLSILLTDLDCEFINKHSEHTD